MLHKIDKDRRLTSASSKMELIGDLAKSQFSGIVGGKNEGEIIEIAINRTVERSVTGKGNRDTA